LNAVFLDTVGLLAVWDRSDQWNLAANGVYRDLISRRETLITTTFVLLECGNAAARRVFRKDVDDLRRVMLNAGTLVTPTDSDCATACSNYRSGSIGDAGIVDHVSFVVMRRLGMKRAFTNHRHCRAAGFQTLF